MKNLINLNNKCFLVTGASSGIGKETSILLSKLGARVILVGRNIKSLEATLSAMEEKNHKIVLCDFTTNNAFVDPFINNITSATNQLNGVVHCAGIQLFEVLNFIEESSMQKLLQINIIAPTLLTKAIHKARLLIRSSSIVFISSISGLTGTAGASAYAASKAAVIASTKSLASELARDGIRVNCIAPSIVKTAMSDNMFSVLGKEQIEVIKKKHLLGLGEPKDVSNVVAFLLGDTAKWITGSCVIVDGGYSLNV